MTLAFIFPLNPYDEESPIRPGQESASLVKTYSGGRRGVTYPDMTWEPKASFWAVADYYSKP